MQRDFKQPSENIWKSRQKKQLMTNKTDWIYSKISINEQKLETITPSRISNNWWRNRSRTKSFNYTIQTKQKQLWKYKIILLYQNNEENAGYFLLCIAKAFHSELWKKIQKWGWETSEPLIHTENNKILSCVHAEYHETNIWSQTYTSEYLWRLDIPMVCGLSW